MSASVPVIYVGGVLVALGSVHGGSDLTVDLGGAALDKIVKEARPSDVSKQQWDRELARGWDVQLIIE
jgi:hypothetical protein